MARKAAVKSKSELAQNLIDAAEEQGWRVDRRHGGHILFLPPDPQQGPIFTSSTPSDWRSAKNLRSRLRRAGLKVD